MSEISTRLTLPYLMPSQAQKHVTHNEALRLLDALVQLSVVAFEASDPPATPAEGAVYALGPAPTGAWAGAAGRLALWSEGAWIFVTPGEGWRAVAPGEGRVRLCLNGDWVLPETVDQLGINTSADAVNRLAVAATAALFSHDGAGHQLKINKAGTTETGSLLFQSNWSGRAEIGLAGSDDVTLKVSADGSTWAEALRVASDGSAIRLTVAAGDGITMDDVGQVGIGVAAPARRLHLGDALRLEPGAAPASPAAGDLYFDSATGKLRCHDGSVWHDLF